MLGKLIKYEFRDTAKLMLVTYAALVIATFTGALAMYRLSNGFTNGLSDLSGLVCLILFIAYTVAAVGIYIGNFIYLCNRYHKTMYSVQGYLTHTLPVEPISVLNAKMLTSYAWMFLSSILTALSVLLTFSLGTGENIFQTLANIDWHSFWVNSGFDAMGVSPAFFITVLVLKIIFSLLYALLLVYASMAIGQLFHASKIGFSILAGFCIYLIQQFFNTILVAVSGYKGYYLGTRQVSASERVGSAIQKLLVGDLLSVILFSALLYAICVYVNKKRLNLE